MSPSEFVPTLNEGTNVYKSRLLLLYLSRLKQHIRKVFYDTLKIYCITLFF